MKRCLLIRDLTQHCVHKCAIKDSRWQFAVPESRLNNLHILQSRPAKPHLQTLWPFGPNIKSSYPAPSCDARGQRHDLSSGATSCIEHCHSWHNLRPLKENLASSDIFHDPVLKHPDNGSWAMKWIATGKEPPPNNHKRQCKDPYEGYPEQPGHTKL